MATISADSKPVPAESIIKKPSTTQQQKECEKYLTSHQISTVINQLATSVLFSKPDNPREFMIKKLEEMRGLKVRSQKPTIFSVDNLSALFKMFDVTGKGWITYDQYTEAMKNIGAGKDMNTSPKGVYDNKISHDVFVKEATIALTTEKNE